MAKSRNTKTMTHEEWKDEEARLLAEIKRIRSQGELLSQALSEMNLEKPAVQASRRSPGRFKGRIDVPQAFFAPLSDEDLREIAGG